MADGKLTLVERNRKLAAIGSARRIDITGQRFGRLTVIERDFSRGNQKSFWFCQCDCSQVSSIALCQLRSGKTKSCGCLRNDKLVSRCKKHGMSQKIPEYTIWKAMRGRCNNKNDGSYKDYGGRGIAVCERWNNFSYFFEDMGPRPKGYTIERLDNDGPYSPDNCKWASNVEQSNNKRSNSIILFNGKSQSVADWCRELSLKYSIVNSRISSGWTDYSEIFFGKSEKERRIICFDGINKTVIDWCKELNLNYHTVQVRIYRGWTDPSEILFGKSLPRGK